MPNGKEEPHLAKVQDIQEDRPCVVPQEKEIINMDFRFISFI